MVFLSILFAVIILQTWVSGASLIRDQLFKRWLAIVVPDDVLGDHGPPEASPNSFLSQVWQIFLIVFLPVLLVVGVVYWWFGESMLVWLVLSVAALLHSFGRNEFSLVLERYIDCCAQDDWGGAVSCAQSLGILETQLTDGDWPAMHHLVLDAAAYRGFERIFAVLFWFVILGPLGAMVYRHFMLMNQFKADVNPLVKKCIYIMEWPAVRVFGASLAATGNFAGWHLRWKDNLLQNGLSSVAVLNTSVLGALSVDDNIVQTCAVTRNELDLMNRLYRRTLWLWLVLVAMPVFAG